MTSRICSRCERVAESYIPDLLCRACAIEYFTAMVRTGAALAELHRTCNDSYWNWTAVLGPASAPVERPCRIMGCTDACGTVGGTLCKGHWRKAHERSRHTRNSNRFDTRPRPCRIPGCVEMKLKPRGKLCFRHLIEARHDSARRASAAKAARHMAKHLALVV